ncbi:MAG TPA: hypothetical protein VN643_23905 [Pyrinomonadaceae bacterium]|nr:hypothetical protein [Pyrinomonadaceae bacterium]
MNNLKTRKALATDSADKKVFGFWTLVVDLIFVPGPLRRNKATEQILKHKELRPKHQEQLKDQKPKIQGLFLHQCNPRNLWLKFFALVIAIIIMADVAGAQTKGQKAKSNSDRLVTITLVRWPYT